MEPKAPQPLTKREQIGARMAEAIRERRKSLNRMRGGYTQADVAERLGDLRGVTLGREGYSKYEQTAVGDRNEIASSDLILLAQILEVPLRYLYGDMDEQELTDYDTIANFRGLASEDRRMVNHFVATLRTQKVYAEDDADETIHGSSIGKKAGE